MYGVQTDRQTVCGSVLSAVLRADDSAGVLRGGGGAQVAACTARRGVVT